MITFLLLILSNCVRDESCRETLAQVSPNGSIIQDAAVNVHSLRFLIKAQINEDKYVSQKTALRCPNSLTKAMDGLFKYIRNRAWFDGALSYWGHLETARFGACAKRKKARHA